MFLYPQVRRYLLSYPYDLSIMLHLAIRGPLCVVIILCSTAFAHSWYRTLVVYLSLTLKRHRAIS